MAEEVATTVEALTELANTLDPPATHQEGSDSDKSILSGIADKVQDYMATNLPKCHTSRQRRELRRSVGEMVRTEIATAKLVDALRKGIIPRAFREERDLGTPFGGDLNEFDDWG